MPQTRIVCGAFVCSCRTCLNARGFGEPAPQSKVDGHQLRLQRKAAPSDLHRTPHTHSMEDEATKPSAAQAAAAPAGVDDEDAATPLATRLVRLSHASGGPTAGLVAKTQQLAARLRDTPGDTWHERWVRGGGGIGAPSS